MRSETLTRTSLDVKITLGRGGAWEQVRPHASLSPDSP